jgi:hypothetical protein
MSGKVRHNSAAQRRAMIALDSPAAADLRRRNRNVQLKAKELVGKRTHELERNILTRVDPLADGLRGRVIAGEQLDDARAVWNHDGTKPHTIRPRTKKALKFTVGGTELIRRGVHHPGTKATKFLQRAGDQEARR